MIRNELRVSVRSGELVIGLLARATHGAEERSSWSLTGLHPPQYFEWRGGADTDHDVPARRLLVALGLLGLEQIAPLQRGAR